MSSCAKGSVRAVIGGKQTCLEVGQPCAKQFQRAYGRYKFQCASGRLKRVREYLDDDTFCFTYGDAVSSVDISALIISLKPGSWMCAE